MSSFIPYQQTVALAFSIGSLTLSPLISYFNRNLSHSLFIVQMAYLFGNVYASNTTLFANRLDLSWLRFMPSFLTYCGSSSIFDCNNSKLISTLIGWIALTILLSIIVKIIKTKRPNASFQPVYNFFKGIFRWTIVPLFYNSMVALQIGLNTQQYHRDYYGSLIVLIIYGLIGLFELIAYKCTEEESEDKWKKWIQLFKQVKVASCVTLVSLSFVVNPIFKYFLYVPIIFYDILHLTKYSFTFKILQRFIFVLQQSIFITIYSLFLFDAAHINQYNLDFMGIALTILLELIMLIAKIFANCKFNGDREAAVKNDIDTPSAEEPQQTKKTLSKQKSTTKLAPIKKQNSFLADINLDDNSYAQLNVSTSSPRKGNRGK